MTTIQVYRNRRNSNKYIEVHNDGHYHNSLKQYEYTESVIKYNKWNGQYYIYARMRKQQEEKGGKKSEKTKKSKAKKGGQNRKSTRKRD